MSKFRLETTEGEPVRSGLFIPPARVPFFSARAFAVEPAQTSFRLSWIDTLLLAAGGRRDVL